MTYIAACTLVILVLLLSYVLLFPSVLDKKAVICFLSITHETLEISEQDSLCGHDWLTAESATIVIPTLDYIGSRVLKSPVFQGFFLRE